MKIWVTSPFDDGGIKEMETIGDPVGDIFRCTDGCTYQNWYRAGRSWHRSRDAAVIAAANFRAARIARAAAEIAKLAALPAVE